MTALESPAAPEALKERRPATRPSLRHVRPYAGLLLPLTLALAWEYAVHAGWSDGRLLPPPSRIAATLLELARNGDLTTHILATLARVGAGFFFGALAGGWNALVTVVGVILVGVGAMLPFVVALGIPAAAVVYVLRRRKRVTRMNEAA